MTPENTNPVIRFVQLYTLPGEGLVAEFRRGSETLLFDRQGLQFRIVELKRAGAESGQEEVALAQINLLSAPHGL